MTYWPKPVTNGRIRNRGTSPVASAIFMRTALEQGVWLVDGKGR